MSDEDQKQEKEPGGWAAILKEATTLEQVLALVVLAVTGSGLFLAVTQLEGVAQAGLVFGAIALLGMVVFYVGTALLQRSKQPAKPKLLMDRKEAGQRLTTQIRDGNKLIDTDIGSDEEFLEFRSRGDSWDRKNAGLLETMFDSPLVAEEYTKFDPTAGFAAQGLEYEVALYKDRLRGKLDKLEQIMLRSSLTQPPQEARLEEPN